MVVQRRTVKSYSRIAKPSGTNCLKSLANCKGMKRVIIVPRVSSWQQVRRGCLKRQERWLRWWAEKHGLEVVGVVRRVESGWHYSNLEELREEAIRLNAGILVVRPNRLARSRA